MFLTCECMLNITYRFQLHIDSLCASQLLLAWFLTYVKHITNVEMVRFHAQCWSSVRILRISPAGLPDSQKSGHNKVKEFGI